MDRITISPFPCIMLQGKYCTRNKLMRKQINVKQELYDDDFWF
jgi:hypothetical protein